MICDRRSPRRPHAERLAPLEPASHLHQRRCPRSLPPACLTRVDIPNSSSTCQVSCMSFMPAIRPCSIASRTATCVAARRSGWQAGRSRIHRTGSCDRRARHAQAAPKSRPARAGGCRNCVAGARAGLREELSRALPPQTAKLRSSRASSSQQRASSAKQTQSFPSPTLRERAIAA